MKKGYCEKHEGKDCSKCLFDNSYHDQPPCKHYVYNNKGYEGKLKDVEGVKMRRQWFLTIAIMSFYQITMITLAVSILVFSVSTNTTQAYSGIDIVLLLFLCFVLPFEICLLILSGFNLKFFGKIVAVINDDGVYTNQAFLRWQEITEIEFYPHVFHYRGIGESAYVKIVSKKGTYKIAHMPLIFLYKAKKYNPEIKTKINKKEIKWNIIIFVACIVLPVVIRFIIM